MIHVRRAGEADAGAVLALLRQLGRSDDAGALEALLADPAHVLLVAADGDRVVGYVNVNVRLRLRDGADVATIDELVVAAGCRGDGVGTRLVEEAVAIARARGAAAVETASALAHGGSHRLLEAIGFERAALTFVRPL